MRAAKRVVPSRKYLLPKSRAKSRIIDRRGRVEGQGTKAKAGQAQERRRIASRRALRLQNRLCLAGPLVADSNVKGQCGEMKAKNQGYREPDVVPGPEPGKRNGLAGARCLMAPMGANSFYYRVSTTLSTGR